MAHSAPGKHYRKGLTLPQVMRTFRDDAAAERWFAKVRWPDGPRCPRCGTADVRAGTAHKSMPYRCRPCRRYFSVRIGTVMEDSKLGYQTWALAIYLLTTGLKGQSSMKLHRDLGITQKSAWHLAHRIRETWREAPAPFGGPVEVDEAYIGGKRRNMSLAKRREMAGRGPVGKTMIAGAKDRETGEINATVLPDGTWRALREFVREAVVPGAQLFTDDSDAYSALPEFRHESVHHTVREYVRGQAHTNGIEAFWSLLKRGYVGTYHRMSPKHLGRYVDEFAGRHNIRDADTVEQMRTISRGFLGRRLEYATLIASR